MLVYQRVPTEISKIVHLDLWNSFCHVYVWFIAGTGCQLDKQSSNETRQASFFLFRFQTLVALGHAQPVWMCESFCAFEISITTAYYIPLQI